MTLFPPPPPPLPSPFLQSQKHKKKQEKAEALQLREAQSEAGRTAIAGALRITSALTLIDEGAKEELREGRNGAPVSGGGLRQRRWSGTQYLNLEDHLRGYFVSPLLPPLPSSLPSSPPSPPLLSSPPPSTFLRWTWMPWTSSITWWTPPAPGRKRRSECESVVWVWVWVCVRV